MKKIAVANQKGGCGKTTTTINLAGSLASLGKRVLLVDLDPQSHASFGLGMVNQPFDRSIYNILTYNAEKKRSIENCIFNAIKNLDVIPSNILLSTLEQELKDKDDAVSRLHEVLSDNKLNYDYVLIDCPPSLGFLTFNALRAAELVVVPIDMSAFSLMGVGKLLGMLELVKLNINHAPRVKALATLFDKRTKYSQNMLDEIKSFFKDQMLHSVIRTNVALKKAITAGVPVIQFEKHSNGAQDYLALAKELLSMEGNLDFEKVMAEVTSIISDEPVTTVPRQGISRIKDIPLTPEEVTVKAPVEEKAVIEQTVNSNLSETVSTESAVSLPLKEAVFSVTAPAAKDIYIVGDFNNWKIIEENRLSRLEDGKWEKRVTLPAGSYKYKFVVDGEWILDSHNSLKEPNPFGSFDSIINV